jgi:hypothetical protein
LHNVEVTRPVVATYDVGFLIIGIADMNILDRAMRALVAVFALSVLTACGGGGGDRTPPPAVVQGVVAAGKPLAGYTVRLMTTGYQGMETVTDADGRYSFEVGTLRPPFSLAAYAPRTTIGPYQRLLSVALQPGTVNVTPLTDLLVVQLLHKPQLADIDLDDLLTLAATTEQRVAQARQQVVDYLLTRPSKYAQNATAAVDVSAVRDFLATPFQPKAGDPYDDALERLTASLMDDETLDGVEEHMLNRAVAPAALDGLAPDAAIYCLRTICGLDDGHGNPGRPRLALSALLKRAMVQMLNTDPFLPFDCDTAPTIKGIKPGRNHFYVDGTVLRINNDVNGGYAIHLASASAIAIHLAKDASSSGNHIATMYTYPSIRRTGARALSLEFDQDGKTVRAEISEKQDGDAWNTVECHPI